MNRVFFEVQSIIGSRINPLTGRKQYRVKWQDYSLSEATWENKQNLQLVADLIQQYEKAQAKHHQESPSSSKRKAIGKPEKRGRGRPPKIHKKQTQYNNISQKNSQKSLQLMTPLQSKKPSLHEKKISRRQSVKNEVNSAQKEVQQALKLNKSVSKVSAKQSVEAEGQIVLKKRGSPKINNNSVAKAVNEKNFQRDIYIEKEPICAQMTIPGKRGRPPKQKNMVQQQASKKHKKYLSLMPLVARKTPNMPQQLSEHIFESQSEQQSESQSDFSDFEQQIEVKQICKHKGQLYYLISFPTELKWVDHRTARDNYSCQLANFYQKYLTLI